MRFSGVGAVDELRFSADSRKQPGLGFRFSHRHAGYGRGSLGCIPRRIEVARSRTGETEPQIVMRDPVAHRPREGDGGDAERTARRGRRKRGFSQAY